MSVDAAERVRESQSWQWRERLINFLIPRLSGDEASKEQTLEMVMASVSEAHSDGIRDCAWILNQLASQAVGDRKFVLATAEKALNELLRKNSMIDNQALVATTLDDHAPPGQGVPLPITSTDLTLDT